MSEYRLCTYTPIKHSEFTQSISSYKDYISREPDVHGVKWVYHSTNTRKGAETGEKRKKTYNLWVAYYHCHRSGNPRVRKDQPAGGKTQKTRPVQKMSKKIDCPAKLIVSCPESDVNTVILKYSGVHNHVPGSIDDLRYLPISQNLRDVIEERLKSGFEQRSIRASIIKYFNDITRTQYQNAVEGSQVVIHRDQFLHGDEVYNIYRKIKEKTYTLHKDVMVSTELWLGKLSKKGFMAYKSTSFTSSYTLAFLSPYQLNTLKRCKDFCLDATHGVTNINNGILYTIVVRHPDSETGFPVAYCFTNDHSTTPLVEFLTFLLTLGMEPNKITIDVSKTELAAIEMVFPTVNVQWCLFHVGRAWMQKIREYVCRTHVSTADNKALHEQTMRDLKTIVHEKSIILFPQLLNAFFVRYSEFPQFIEYFKKNYINNDWYKHWCKAFQPQYDTNMETNNYVESWHNQLKTTYLKRKPNRRLDRLIYILVDEVEPEFINNVNRIILGIGRMGNREREEVKRRTLAEDIPNERVEEYVNEERGDDGGLTALLVKVFDESSQNTYRITVVDKKMINCECNYFNFYKKPCKHMYLGQRLYEDIKVYQIPIQQLTYFQQNTKDTTHTIHANSESFDNFQKQQNSTVVNDVKNLLDYFSTAESQECFDEEDWEALNALKKRLTMRKLKIDEVSLPNNSNLNTQRR